MNRHRTKRSRLGGMAYREIIRRDKFQVVQQQRNEERNEEEIADHEKRGKERCDQRRVGAVLLALRDEAME